MVEVLGVAFEDVGVALVLRQCFDERMENATFQGVKRRGKGEVVETAEDDDLRISIEGEDTVHEIVHDLCLLSALHLGAQGRRLEAAEEWIVAAFRIEVVADE